MNADELIKRHRDAEQQLDRELDESKNRERVAWLRTRPRGPYSLALVIVVAAVGGLASYLTVFMVLKAGAAPLWSYVISAALIAAIAWGASGINRTHAARSERLVDIVLCIIVGGILYALVAPPALWDLFQTSHGLDGAPRFHHVITWAAIASCAAVALASLVRLGLDARVPIPGFRK